MAARDMKYNLRQDENESMRVIIDCDPGNGVPGANIDDGLALALAIAAPQITLEMITTVAGNTPVETGYAVAKELVRQLDIPVSVYRGAARALREDPLPWRENLIMASIALAYASYGRTSLPRQRARPCSLWHHRPSAS